MGRHPGWPNAIDQFGRINATAHMARRVLFEHAVSLAAARGVWDKVPEAHRVDGLTHDILWLPAPDEAQPRTAGAVGRVWMSRDASGRSGPMMVLACIESAAVSWVAEQVLPRLVAVEKMCRETNSAELVRLSIGEAQHQVEDTLALLVGAARPSETDEQLLAALSGSPWPGRRSREDQCAALIHAVQQGATHLRVPKVLEGVRAIRSWGAFAQRLVQDSRALLVMARDRAAYIDIFLGGPDAPSLIVLRADETHTALSTLSGEEPGEDSRKAAAQLFRGVSSGSRGARRSSSDRRPSRRTGLVLCMVAAVLLAVVATWLIVSRAKQPTSRAESPATPRPLVLQDGAPSEPTDSGQPSAADSSTNSREILPEKLSEIDSRIAALADELRDQHLPAPDDLSSRAVVLREQFGTNKPITAIVDDANTLRREVDARRGEAAGRVLAFLKEQSAAPPAGLPPHAREAWASRVLKIGPREGMAHAERELTSIRAEIMNAAAEIARAYGFEIPATAPIDVNALRAARDLHQEEAMRQAGSNAGRDPWPDAARSAIDAATSLDAALRQGKLLSEEHNGQSVRAWSQQLHAAAATPDVGAAVSPVEGRARELERVAALESPGALLAAIGVAADAPGSRISEVRTAWQRLSEQGWPASASDFATLAHTRKNVIGPAIAVMPDVSARASVQHDIDTDAVAMWKAGVQRAVRTESDLNAAMAEMDSVGVAQSDLASLPEWAQFSIARARLIDGIAKGNASAIQSAAREFVQDHAADTRLWPELQVHHPGIAALADAARRVASPDAYPSLATLGPGSLGWTLTQGDGGVITYTSPDGTTASFAPANGSTATVASQPVSYLATTEFSVAQAGEVSRSPKWSEVLRTALPDYRLDASDPRLGVRTWGWTKVPGKGWEVRPPESNPAGGWQRVSSKAESGKRVAPGVVPSIVSADAPMQSISPQGAATLAAAMGCRLASVQEWKTAADGCDPAAGNLRDAQFAAQAEWVRSKGADAGVAPPSTDIFRASNSQRTMTVDDTSPAVSIDDKELWFTGHQARGPFENLVGNVAEFVVDDPHGLVDGINPEAEALRAAGLKVIGGSALSIGYPTLEPQSIDPLRAASGFADVGFRIAFTAAAGARATAPEQELRDALAHQPALFPDK